jgi:predicted RNase H-like HicB family nuclease
MNTRGAMGHRWRRVFKIRCRESGLWVRAPPRHWESVADFAAMARATIRPGCLRLPWGVLFGEVVDRCYDLLMTRSYKVVFEPEKDGGYSVYVPDLPGCASQGETEEEALANIREAIEGYIEGLKADGLPVPEPHTKIRTVEIQAA